MNFDSEEERLFWFYVDELKSEGFVDEFTYQPTPFILSEPVNYNWIKKLKTKDNQMESILLHGHIYTSDFNIRWNKKAEGIFYYDIDSGKKLLNDVPFINNINNIGDSLGSYIDVKGTWNMFNMIREFKINMKWVYEKYKVFVQIVKPIGGKNCLFAKTFTPYEATITKKTRKPKKLNFKNKTLNEYLKYKYL